VPVGTCGRDERWPDARFRSGTAAKLRVSGRVGYFRACPRTEGGRVAWILKLVKIGGEGDDPGTDLMEISRPDGLGDIADLGLALAEAKLLLASVQREIAAAQTRAHVLRRPDCPRCNGVCRVKDYRHHAVTTLFGQVMMKLPRFRCAGRGETETGIDWPSHCRSTPELDRLRAHPMPNIAPPSAAFSAIRIISSAAVAARSPAL
jgi:hypothetical protein